MKRGNRKRRTFSRPRDSPITRKLQIARSATQTALLRAEILSTGLYTRDVVIVVNNVMEIREAFLLVRQVLARSPHLTVAARLYNSSYLLRHCFYSCLKCFRTSSSDHRSFSPMRTASSYSRASELHSTEAATASLTRRSLSLSLSLSLKNTSRVLHVDASDSCNSL